MLFQFKVDQQKKLRHQFYTNTFKNYHILLNNINAANFKPVCHWFVIETIRTTSKALSTNFVTR